MEEMQHKEARPEDLQKIAQLQQLVEKLRNELKEALSKHEWYRKELIAREEAYNKRFHSEQPNVGVPNIPGVPKAAMQAK